MIFDTVSLYFSTLFSSFFKFSSRCLNCGDSLKTRAGESVFKEGAVGEIDERSMMLDRIEGYIDLGMFDEASEALLELTEGGGENAVDVLRLRYLLCAKQHGVDEAAKLLEDWRREGFVADDWNPDAP